MHWHSEQSKIQFKHRRLLKLLELTLKRQSQENMQLKSKKQAKTIRYFRRRLQHSFANIKYQVC